MCDNSTSNLPIEAFKYEQYKLLIQARNFHYDNYNKWMTYFYVAMGVFFVGYYTLATSKGDNDFIFEKIALLTVGYLTSFLGHM